MATFTLSEIDSMSADVFAAKMKDPEFVKLVNSLTPPEPVPADPDDPNSLIPVEDVPEAVVLPVVPAESVPPVAPVELPELRHEFQPVDEYGKPLGGKQVIKYRTQQELIDKMTEQNILLVRKLREEKRNNRLGISEDKIPDDAERLRSVELKPKELSVEERFQLTQDMNDPEKFSDARDRFIESSLGAKPAEIRDLLNDAQKFRLETAVQNSFYEFVQLAGPSFFNDEANRTTLTDWMVKNRLAPTVANFETAYANVAGLLHGAPVVQQAQPAAVIPPAPVEEKPAQASVVPEARISQPEQPQLKHQIQAPSGLNDRVSSSSGQTPVDAKSLTLVDIDKMPADVYGRKMKDPAFRKYVDKLEAEKAAKLARQVENQ